MVGLQPDPDHDPIVVVAAVDASMPWERVPVVVTEAYGSEVQMIDVRGAISASVNAMRAPITVPAFFFRLPFHLIKPSALPTLANAASARSSWSAEWAADNWTRMRACPRGTTGNEKPTT